MESEPTKEEIENQDKHDEIDVCPIEVIDYGDR